METYLEIEDYLLELFCELGMTQTLQIFKEEYRK